MTLQLPVMDGMGDAPARQSVALPSISQLSDSSRIRRDEDEQSRRSGLPLSSPSLFRFGNGPSQYNVSAGSSGGLISPPDSRRTSSEEQYPLTSASNPAPAHSAPPTAGPVPPRQSLPSIHEALKQDSAVNYPGVPPPSTPAVPTSSSAFYSHPSSTAPPEPIRRDAHPYPKGPPPPLSLGSHAPSSIQSQQSRSNSIPGSSTQSTPMFSSQSSKISPSFSSRGPNSPPNPPARANATYPPPHQPPSSYEQSSPSSSAGGHFSFGSSYPPYPYPPSSSTQPYPTPSSTAQGFPTPPAAVPAPPPYSASGWGTDSGVKRELRPIKAYETSIKRKFDQFDVEAVIYQIASHSGSIHRAADDCAKRALEARNSGENPVKVVTQDVLDQLSRDLQTVQRTYAQLNDMVHSQPSDAHEGPREFPHPYPNGYNPETNGYESPQPGAMPPDPKKRRGRAAPPGRCHSCNRAETPEWRRGPDGARTLCNACGLHYAKLTRKLGNTNKQYINNSHIRPKDKM